MKSATVITALSAAIIAVLLSPSGPPDDGRLALRITAKPSGSMSPLTGVRVIEAVTPESGPLLPSPVTGGSAAAAPCPAAPPVQPLMLWQHGNPFQRPPGESMMSEWAARDPEGAGRWLNQNRQHPEFADYARGYALQIATMDPPAARLWAAQIPEGQNRFLRGGTLEQHIDAIEEMLRGPAGSPPAEAIAEPAAVTPLFLPDYSPVLVRQNPGEAPVIEMRANSPYG